MPNTLDILDFRYEVKDTNRPWERRIWVGARFLPTTVHPRALTEPARCR